VARRAARALGPATRGLAERLAYRPREVVVVGLLAGGLCAGLAVERWRTGYPAIAERLEAEPPRLATAAVVSPAPRPRRVAHVRCAPPAPRVASPPPRTGAGAPSPRLDLNRATPRELARLAGISWGLAARIVAAREALEAGGPGVSLDPPGRGGLAAFPRRRAALPAARPAPEPAPSVASPEPEPGEGSLDPE
jgi:DNA uptake protein ComE-like DNA-binding protein